MRTEPISQCERQFIIESLRKGTRLDLRSREDFRDASIVVGAECGTAMCTIGQTKVLCAVSASISEPPSMRPQKGVLAIDVDLSPMSNLAHEHDRLGAKGMELMRLLELVIRDSRCVDIESLCIRAGKEVWKVRIDVRVLDEDGSLLDCACMAAITSLQHFRRPNVTLEPHHTIIHSEFEKAPVPLNIYHMPICVTFGFLDKGTTIVIDPTEKEAACLNGSLVVACNKRREVCALHQSTNLVLSTKTMEHCVKLAMKRAESLSDLVSEVIKNDQRQRSAYARPDGFAVTLPREILSAGRKASGQLRPPTTLDIKMEVEEEEEETRQHIQPSMIFNEDPLREKSIKQEEVTEEQEIDAQLASIQNDVTNVGMSETTTVATEQPSGRKREVEEVDELLAGLDDDEEEVQTMQLGKTVADDDDNVLLKAKKKRV